MKCGAGLGSRPLANAIFTRLITHLIGLTNGLGVPQLSQPNTSVGSLGSDRKAFHVDPCFLQLLDRLFCLLVRFIDRVN